MSNTDVKLEKTQTPRRFTMYLVIEKYIEIFTF